VRHRTDTKPLLESDECSLTQTCCFTLLYRIVCTQLLQHIQVPVQVPLHTRTLSLIERVILQVPVQVPVSVWGPEGAQRGPALIFDPRMHATTHLFSGRTHRCTVLARLGMRECRPSPLGLTHPMRCHTRACAPQHTAFGMAGSGTDASQLNVCRATSSCMHGTRERWATAPTRCIMPYMHGGNNRAVTAWAGQTVH
jgi:hypothetical protein